MPRSSGSAPTRSRCWARSSASTPGSAVVAGVVIAGGGAALIGFFCVRTGGIPFLMLTLAFSQLVFSVALKWRDVTGGSDGMAIAEKPSFFGFDLSNSLDHVFHGAELLRAGLSAGCGGCSTRRSATPSSAFARTSSGCSRSATRPAPTSSCPSPSPARSPASPADSTPSSTASSRPTRCTGPPPATSSSWPCWAAPAP